MVQVACPPVIPVTAKYTGGPYDGESMVQVACPPVIPVTAKYTGGPYDGESMATYNYNCQVPLSAEIALLLEGGWLTRGTANLRWEVSREAGVVAYTLWREGDPLMPREAVITLPAVYQDGYAHAYEAVDRVPSPGRYAYWVEALTEEGPKLHSNAVTLEWPARWEVKVWPNPTASTLWVQVELPEATGVRFTLWTVVGQCIYDYRISGQVGLQVHTIDMQGLSSGVYLLQVFTGMGEYKNLRVVRL
ncbi:MAG: hypothetical protein KatS3mg025_0096 [Bacteroidia bacterium]|nr:MAG: hypothetical protein KatS3mg025_0096 [Bacteroidia bacterium]